MNKSFFLVFFSFLLFFACTQKNHHYNKPSNLTDNVTSIEELEKGFVLASQDEYALDVHDKHSLINAYQKWLNDSGSYLIKKFSQGEIFNDNEKPYLRLVKASYIWKAQRMYERFTQGDDSLDEEELEAYRFADSLWKEGKELLKKGYFGEKFSSQEIERLWEYKVICQIRICCPAPYLPFQIGIHKIGEKDGSFLIGTKAPDISWMKMEAAMQSPFYTDMPTYDLYEVIKPKAVDEFFRYFRGYNKKTTLDGRNYVEEIFPQTVPEDDRYVKLTDFHNKKPVLLFISSAMDCFWGRAVLEAEAIYRAYKGQVEIIWLNMSIHDFLIFGNTTNNYYKPYSGVELPGHESNQEDLARTAKKVYMTYPHLTIPCVLDQNSRQTSNYFKSDGGSGTTVLIDKDGRIAWHSTYEWGHWFENRPPGRGEEIAWANTIEKELQKLILNNGKFDPNHELLKRPFISEKDSTEIKSMYMMNGPIVKLDKKNRLISVRSRTSTFSVIGRAPDSFQQFNPLQLFTIEVPKETIITCRNVPIDFDNLSIGDVVIGPEIWKMPDGKWLAKKIRLVPDEKMKEDLPPPVFNGDMYLYGKIAEVNLKKNSIVVLRKKVDLAEMKGYNFIEKDWEKIELFKKAKDNYEIVKNWEDKDKSNNSYNFDLIDALVIKNGEYSLIKDLKEGDFVSIKYDRKDEDKEILKCAVIRASCL